MLAADAAAAAPNKLGVVPVEEAGVAPTRGGPSYAADEVAGGCWGGLVSKRGKRGSIRGRKGRRRGRGDGRRIREAPREYGENNRVMGRINLWRRESVCNCNSWALSF